MKQIITLLLLLLTACFSYGQECGIYRIKYIGSIQSDQKKVITVSLPKTLFLHGLKEEDSKNAFITTPLTNGLFETKINSHLTTPYRNIASLLTFYKQQSGKFKFKLQHLKNETLEEIPLEVDWDNIKVTILKDDGFGTLFVFDLGNIKL
ncbi:MAG TPA: hypothetical protein VJL37_08815 [Flavobacterium sp.]|nr:hypothetical protein [Flavobacterium sp.]